MVILRDLSEHKKMVRVHPIEDLNTSPIYQF